MSFWLLIKGKTFVCRIYICITKSFLLIKYQVCNLGYKYKVFIKININLSFGNPKKFTVRLIWFQNFHAVKGSQHFIKWSTLDKGTFVIKEKWMGALDSKFAGTADSKHSMFKCLVNTCIGESIRACYTFSYHSKYLFLEAISK